MKSGCVGLRRELCAGESMFYQEFRESAKLNLQGDSNHPVDTDPL